MKTPHDIILRPILTEKSYQDMQDKKYVFAVHPDANRTEVKQAIESLFEVKVQKVNIVNQLGKIKRQGYTSGRRPSIKKSLCDVDEQLKSHRILRRHGAVKRTLEQEENGLWRLKRIGQ